MRWIRIAVLGAAAFGAVNTVRGQQPASDPVAAFYGATLEIDMLSGWSAHRFLAPDHTYTQTGSDGPTHGSWVVKGGKLCTIQDQPPPPADRAPRYCNLGPGHKVGDRWLDNDPVTGNAVFFKLTPGR
ncbi:MAG: hypothetical protein ACHP7N_04205 [Caulobacterales bacterium]